MREKWAAIQATQVTSFADLPLLDFVVEVSPKFSRPEHLFPVIPYLEAVYTSPQFFSFSAPPRHGKSQLVFHFIAQFIAKFPHLNVAYCSYSATFAERKSLEIRELARRAGVTFDKSSASRSTWKTDQGGSFLARGPGGPLTGEGIHLLVCDDPYRSRQEAESATIRENLIDWWTSVAMTRLEPGASVVVTHTRWHPEDLIGGYCAEQNWPHVNLPAFGDDGTALWPERYTTEALADRRTLVGEYDWASMFMGSPRPRGGAVFGGTNVYTAEALAEMKFKKIVIGIDCAYSAKTYSDYNVAVVLGIDASDNCWVLDVRKKQCEAMKFADTLRELRMTYGSPPIFWFLSGVEKPVVELFKSKGVPVKGMIAREDKFVRAQAVSAAWNAGKVLVPKEHKPWTESFMSEVLTFTGVGDKHDDQVDALAAAFFHLANVPS